MASEGNDRRQSQLLHGYSQLVAPSGYNAEGNVAQPSSLPQTYAASPIQHAPTSFQQALDVAQPRMMLNQQLGFYDGPMQQIKLTEPIVPDEMACSIVSALCCCICLGIPAIILAAQANNLKFSDPHRANKKAKEARILNIISFLLGAIIITVALVLQRY